MILPQPLIEMIKTHGLLGWVSDQVKQARNSGDHGGTEQLTKLVLTAWKTVNDKLLSSVDVDSKAAGTFFNDLATEFFMVLCECSFSGRESMPKNILGILATAQFVVLKFADTPTKQLVPCNVEGGHFDCVQLGARFSGHTLRKISIRASTVPKNCEFRIFDYILDYVPLN